jgi:hypothetical protein
MPLFDILWQKVIRIELLSVLAPNVRSSMESVKIDDKCNARGYLIIICEKLNWQEEAHN